MCFDASGPQTIVSATSSGVTFEAACSKCAGIGSSCDSSPDSPEFGQSWWASFLHASSSSPQHTFSPAIFTPEPPDDVNRSTCSFDGEVDTNPSPIFAASRTDFSPKPDIGIGTVPSGGVV